METPGKAHIDKYRTFSPIDAVRAWLDGEFGIGDESAMIEAIRKDSRVSLSDDGIIDAILDAMDDGLDAPACMERLAGSK